MIPPPPFINQSGDDVERELVKKKRKEAQSILLPSRANFPSRARFASLVDVPTNLSRRREFLFSVRRHNIECISVHGRPASRSLLYSGSFSRQILLVTPTLFHAGNVLLIYPDIYPECVPVCKSREKRLCRELSNEKYSYQPALNNKRTHEHSYDFLFFS